ncbi:MAG: electron transport complex subunit RsxA [Gammaproteobacteria bacterium]|nr:electron transport complex subunit RsxA [Gammaproteobacteria bacterium]
MFENTLTILIGTVFINNFVLVKFLGLCPFMGVSKRFAPALGMGLATTFVLTLASVLSYLTTAYVLLPYELLYLRTIVFILCIAATVQITELYIKKVSAVLFNLLGIYLPLITTNCAVLGVAVLNQQASNSLFESAWFGFCAALGFTLVLVLFSSIRERLEQADIPGPFKGTPTALLTAGIMSLAFMGFAGMV